MYSEGERSMRPISAVSGMSTSQPWLQDSMMGGTPHHQLVHQLSQLSASIYHTLKNTWTLKKIFDFLNKARSTTLKQRLNLCLVPSTYSQAFTLSNPQGSSARAAGWKRAKEGRRRARHSGCRCRDNSQVIPSWSISRNRNLPDSSKYYKGHSD